MQRAAIIATVAIAFVADADAANAQSLRGSPQAMRTQHSIAQQHDYTFLRTSAQVRKFVDAGYLVRLPGNGNYGLAGVSYPYARPAMKLFVERLAAQYRSACGEKLVVTSLTRPMQKQPRNASALSVHPAGMAVDLRVSRNAKCRRWLESTLLSLEKQGVLDGTRENYPPHYHVALFPTRYTQYVAKLTNGRSTVQLAAATATRGSAATSAVAATTSTRSSGPSAEATADASAETPDGQTADVSLAASPARESAAAIEQYRVNRGDSLWSIARRHGTTVDTLKELNGLKGSAIRVGQTLTLPAVATGTDDDASN